MCSEENKTGNPNTNEIEQKIYWLKNKLWEEGWEGFNNQEQSKTIELLNLLIEEQNFNNFNKETLEQILGYEIHDFKIEPVYFENKLIRFDLKIQPKQKTECIYLDFKILPTNEQPR